MNEPSPVAVDRPKPRVTVERDDGGWWAVIDGPGDRATHRNVAGFVLSAPTGMTPQAAIDALRSALAGDRPTPGENLRIDGATRAMAHALCDGPDGEDWLRALRLAPRALEEIEERGYVMISRPLLDELERQAGLGEAGDRPQQITDEMVERAAEMVFLSLHPNDYLGQYGDEDRWYRIARFALEAALGDPAAAPSPDDDFAGYVNPNDYESTAAAPSGVSEPAPAPVAAPLGDTPSEPSVAAIAAQSLANSERWFPMVHGRGHLATTLHLGLGIGGEAGEVVDVVKKIDVCAGLLDECEMHKPGKHSRRALEDEMADLFTYLLALAAHEGVDLVAAWQRKQAECEERWGAAPSSVGEPETPESGQDAFGAAISQETDAEAAENAPVTQSDDEPEDQPVLDIMKALEDSIAAAKAERRERERARKTPESGAESAAAPAADEERP